MSRWTTTLCRVFAIANCRCSPCSSTPSRCSRRMATDCLRTGWPCAVRSLRSRRASACSRSSRPSSAAFRALPGRQEVVTGSLRALYVPHPCRPGRATALRAADNGQERKQRRKKGRNHPSYVPFHVVFLRNWRQVEADFCPFYAVVMRNWGQYRGWFCPHLCRWKIRR